MRRQFLFEADQQSHFPISQTINDTIALYSSSIHRLTALGPEALTETDTLSLLLDASDSRLAGQLLAEYGSLTGLMRTSLPNLLRFLPQTKAARRLTEGARILQINMLDHVIVGQSFDSRPGYFSFKEAGMI
jgi:DNA repair protein RadC